MRGVGSRAVYTMCKKTSDLAEDGFPNSCLNELMINWQFVILQLMASKVHLLAFGETFDVPSNHFDGGRA